MNIDDLIASIARKLGVSIEQATSIVERLLSEIGKALERGESVNLSGFGKFHVKTRAARTGRNPRSGDSIQIPGDRVPAFKPAQALVNLIQEIQDTPAPVSSTSKRTTRSIKPAGSPPADETPEAASGSDPEAEDRPVRRASRSVSPPVPPSLTTLPPAGPLDRLTNGNSRGVKSRGIPRMEESHAPATETDERRINAHILFAGKKRQTFVRGAENTIRCWIGLPEENVPTSSEAIPTVAIPDEGLPLTVQLLWRSESDTKIIILPANRTARSGDCDLRLQIPDDAPPYISAELSFRYRGSVFEMIRVEAFVLNAGEPEQAHHKLLLPVETQRREAIEIKDRKEVDATIIWGEDRSQVNHPGDTAPSALRVFGRGDPKHYDLSDADKTINWLNNELFITTASLVNKRADAGDAGEDRLDDQDTDVIRILRTLAEHGTELYNQLTDEDFVDPGERIQLINTEPKEYVPIEFVYDRGYPASDATICVDGIKALNSNAEDCPTCKPAHILTPEERDEAKVICPFGFWSIKKIIERRDPDNMSSTADGHPSVPRANRRSLPVINRALFASSYRVPEDERTKTQAALSACIQDSQMALSWTDWRNKLKEGKPPLLLVLPHHHVEDNQDFLEIGADNLKKNDRLLARGRMTDVYVNPDKVNPGPIVILMGCRTAAGSETGYVQLARKFQHLSTSIVVGTLGKVLGRHAAPVARELVAELVSVSDSEADFGTIMRTVRRRMLGKGYLMALCIVALGDAEWRLTPK